MLFFRLTIRDERELTAFVVRTCLISAGAALFVDVVSQTVFFESWTTSLRSWSITVTLATAIAFPVSRAIGKAHLALFRAMAKVEVLSRTDELTGLLNRRALMEMAATQPPETMVLVIADIDRFKRVNDNHGHMAGDAVIRMVSRIASAELGDLGALGRFGGEEFALLTSDVSPSLLVLRLENLRTRIALTPVVAESGTAIHVTISAGVAIRGVDRDFDALYADTDRALYAAKASGRNRISYSPLFEKTCGTTLAHRAAIGRRKGDSDDDLRRLPDGPCPAWWGRRLNRSERVGPLSRHNPGDVSPEKAKPPKAQGFHRHDGNPHCGSYRQLTARPMPATNHGHAVSYTTHGDTILLKARWGAFARVGQEFAAMVLSTRRGRRPGRSQSVNEM